MPFKSSGLPPGETNSFPRVVTNLVCPPVNEGARPNRITAHKQACIFTHRVMSEISRASLRSRLILHENGAVNFRQTGDGTSAVCPVELSRPVFRSTRKTTMLSEF